MNFQHEYFSTLDRGFYDKGYSDADSDGGVAPRATDKVEGSTLTLKDIGTTADANIHPIQALQAKIREGAAKVEMIFLGAGKSGFGGQSATPEVVGKLEREQLRELAKLNQVKVTTHATPGMQGLAGIDPRKQPKFDDEYRKSTLKEIDKAIDFAAQATTGGAVVFHTGEWQRPIFEAGQSKENRMKGNIGMFREYETEEKKAAIPIADARTGVIQYIPRDQMLFFAEEEYDPKSGINYVKKDSTGAPIVKQLLVPDAVKYMRDKHKTDKELYNPDGTPFSDEQILHYAIREQELRSSKGERYRYLLDVEENREKLNKILQAKEYVKTMWDQTPEKDRWRLMEQVGISHSKWVNNEFQDPMKTLESEERFLRQRLEGDQRVGISTQERYQGIMNDIYNTKPIEEVGLKKAADTIATAGLHAMQATARYKPDDPVYISPEAYEPQFYGSHPDEIRKIINGSRDAMAAKLRTQGYSPEEAKEKAKTHIRATLDSGHFNMWRQHFQANPGERPEAAEKRFEKWYLDQTEKLAKEGLIGHVHLTDNFGYDDEHLTPGQGNVPLKEFVKRMEKAGVKDMIVERGSFNGQTVLADTLTALGSPLYATAGRIGPGFNTIRNGHFGYAAPPNYIVGAYAPSNEWKLWSEVPLE